MTITNNATGSRYVLDIANTLKENVTCGNAPTIKPGNQHTSICTIVTELIGLVFVVDVYNFYISVFSNCIFVIMNSELLPVMILLTGHLSAIDLIF